MADYANMARQGRAKSPFEPWQPEELEAVLLIERERGIPREQAAEYVRNGIMTLVDYDKAVAKKIAPKSLNEMVETVKAQTRKALKGGKKK